MGKARSLMGTAGAVSSFGSFGLMDSSPKMVDFGFARM